MKYLSVILAIFGLEWKLKNHIEKTVREGEIRKRWGGFLLIRKHHNRGAFLNAGQDRSGAVAALSVVLTAALAVFFWLIRGKEGRGLMKWGLTLLLGGACSNTCDRLARKYVVDYVSFHVPVPGRWKKRQRGQTARRHLLGGRVPARFEDVVFNLGDFCIMAGALLCVLGYGEERTEI